MEGAFHQGKADGLARAQGGWSDSICGQETERDEYWCPVASSSMPLELYPTNIHSDPLSSFTRNIVIGYSKSLEGHIKINHHKI